ncbi:MAG TPA: hypothetical protein PKA32_02495 [Candidatus Gracilibacteria bacterium]|nr:hypothetical protein [Candidatus Gracilibacteria bacterium]
MNDSHKKIENEDIIIHVNRHWVQLIKPLLSLFLVWSLALSFIHLAFLSNEQMTANIHFIGAVIILTIGNHWFFYRLLHWQLSSSLITNQRVIHFRNMPFVRNDILYVRIDEIHEVEEKMPGLLPNLLDYGSAIINLAAVTETISLNYIPHPATFTNLIEIIRENKHEEIDVLRELCEPYSQKYKKHPVKAR